jgi:hypothetical protein
VTHRSRVLALVIALAISAVYGLPQLLYFADGHPDALIHTTDESPYFARVQEVMDGHWRVSDPYLWETKTRPAIVPYAPELLLGSIGKALGLDIDTLVILVRSIAPASLAIAIMWFAFLVTQSVGWSILSAAVVLLEPGSYYSQPFHYLTSLVGSPDSSRLQLLYQRFHNPVVLLIPCVLALAGIFRALHTQQRSAIYLAGMLLGLNFYTQVFYWTFLYAGLCVLLVIERRNRERVRVVFWVALLGLAWGSLALVDQVLRTQAMEGQDLLTRGGLLVQTRAPINLLPKAFLLATIAFALFTRPRDLAYKWLLSCLAGGYVLLNQNLITGREIQNYHFNYANAVVLIVAMALWMRHAAITMERRPIGHWKYAGVALTVAVVWLLGNALTLQANAYRRHISATTTDEGKYPSNLKAEFRETLDWIRTNTPVDAVFLADPNLSFVIPIYTGGNVFLNPLQRDHAASALSEEALFERWVIYLKVHGTTSPEVFEQVKRLSASPFLGWGFGRNERLLAKYDFSTAENFSRALEADDLPRDYVREYDLFDIDRIPELLRKYRLDYLVVRDADTRFSDVALTFLREWDVRPIARMDREGVTIYHISRSQGSTQP